MPSSRFLIASLIPESIAAKLRQAYQRAYDQPCTIKSLHTTLIPPFTTVDPVSISTFLASLFSFSTPFIFGPPGIFTAPGHRQILYVPLLPQAPLQNMYHQIMTMLNHQLIIETQSFTQNKVPEFLAHVTLNYHFESLSRLYQPPPDSFMLPKPQLLYEDDNQTWIPYST